MIRGTRKKPPCRCGACARTVSRSRHGRKSSSRVTLRDSTTCAVAGTLAMSSSESALTCPSRSPSCCPKRSISSSVRARRASVATYRILIASCDKSDLESNERLDVAGLWKHIEWLHDDWPVTVGHEVLRIPCERRGVARKIPQRRNASSRDCGEAQLLTPLARRVEEDDAGVVESGAQSRRVNQPFHAAGLEAHVSEQSIAPR